MANVQVEAVVQHICRVRRPQRNTKLATAIVLALCLLSMATGWLFHQTLAAKAPILERDEGRKAAKDDEQKAHRRVDSYGDPLPAGAINRLGTLRFRHGGGTINGLLLSADGKTLVTNTYYGSRTVCVWELATGNLLHQLPGHYEESGAVALSPDGKTVAVGHDKLIRFWDVASGREVRQLKAPQGGVQGLAFSADGKTLASGHSGDTVLLWDLAAGTVLARLPASHNRLTLLAFTPDGKTLLSGDSLDPRVRLFDVATRKQRHELTRPIFVRGFALSRDGNLLALGAQQGSISIWDVESAKLIREFAGAAHVLGVAFSPNGKTLAAAEYDQTWNENAVVLWDVATGKQLRRLNDAVQVHNVAFSVDGQTLITGSGGGTIRLWDVATGVERGRAPGNPRYVGNVTVSPDGRTLAYTADSSIRLWDLTEEREVARLPGHHWSIAFAPDGKTLGGGTDVNKVNFWNVAERRLLRRFESDPKNDGYEWVAYYRIAFSPDGKLFARAGRGLLPGGRSIAPVLQLCDPSTGKELHRLSPKNGASPFSTLEGAIAFAPDGKTIAASGRGHSQTVDANRHPNKIVVVWDVATGKELGRLSAAMNDASENEPEPAWFPSGPIIEPRIVFSANGKMLAMNRSSKTIPVWEAATGRQRLVLKGHQDSTVCVAFAPDSRTLASAGYDNTIRLWDLETANELRQLAGHRGKANSLAFSRDGKTLISAGDDTTILCWDVATITGRPRPRIDRLAPKEWESLWTELASADAAKAHQAMQRLISAPTATLHALSRRLRPVPMPDPQRLAQLFTDLDSKQFAVRDKAHRELEKLGDAIKADLERALAKPDASLELRRRLDRTVALLEVPSGDWLRDLRAVEVLEHIGTPQAQSLLKTLSEGAAQARLTQEAKSVLERMARR